MAADEMLYGDILDDDFGRGGSPHTPLEDEAYGDLFDDVLKTNQMEQAKIPQEVPQADLALLDPPEERIQPQSDTGGVASTFITGSASALGQPQAFQNEDLDIYGKPRPKTIYQEPMKKHALYIGNMTWWTTDEDLIAFFQRWGFPRIRALKFYENRTNGQSKGCALVEVTSEEEVTAAVEKLLNQELNKQNVITASAVKMNIHQFESLCKGEDPGISSAPPKPVPKPQIPHNPKPQISSSAVRAPLLTEPANVAAGMGIGAPGMGMGIGMGMPLGGMPPDPLGLMTQGLPFPGFPPGLAGFPRPAFPDISGGTRPTAPHINPAVLFKSQWNDTSGGGNSPSTPALGGGGNDEEELANVMHRNQQVSSTAIERANKDAEEGDINGALDTLRMAINIIKQSSVASMDSTQVLIKSLQECMANIEEQASGVRKSKQSRYIDDRSRHSDRSRERDRDRESHRKSRHRDRSRERRHY